MRKLRSSYLKVGQLSVDMNLYQIVLCTNQKYGLYVISPSRLLTTYLRDRIRNSNKQISQRPYCLQFELRSKTNFNSIFRKITQLRSSFLEVGQISVYQNRIGGHFQNPLKFSVPLSYHKVMSYSFFHVEEFYISAYDGWLGDYLS